MKPHTQSRAPRTKLSVRIVLIVVAALLFVGAGVAEFNAYTVHTTNSIVNRLNSNIKTLQKNDPDLDQIAASQKIIDSQLDNAHNVWLLHFPQVSASLDDARELSQQLDQLLDTKQKQAQAAEQLDNANGPAADNPSGSGTTSSSEGDSTSEQDSEAQKKLESLLQQNAPTGKQQFAPKDAANGTTAKPW
jgi:hypothetical protein